MSKFRYGARIVFIIVLYVLFILWFELILGFGVGDIWDKLIRWANRCRCKKSKCGN